MPDITADLTDICLKLCREIETLEEADALRKLLPAVRLIMLDAQHAEAWKLSDLISGARHA